MDRLSGDIRMMRTATFISFVCLMASPALAEEPKQRERPADEVLSAGLAAAKEKSKRVFLLFGSPG